MLNSFLQNLVLWWSVTILINTFQVLSLSYVGLEFFLIHTHVQHY